MTDTGQVPGEGQPESAGRVQQPGMQAPAAYTFADPSDNPAEDDDLLLMPGAQGAWSEAQTAQPGTGGQPPAAQPYADANAGQAFPGQAAVGQAVAADPQHGQGGQSAQDGQNVQDGPHGQGAQSGPQGQSGPNGPAGNGLPAFAHQPGPHETSGRDSGSVDLTGVPLHASHHSVPAAQHSPTRRPLHRGPAAPAVPDGAGSPVRSLADRGPAGGTPHPMPVRHAGPPTAGPEYLDIPRDDAGALAGPQLGEIPPQAAAPWTPQPQDSRGAAAETVVPEGARVTEATGVTSATGVSVVTGDSGVTEDAGAAGNTGASENTGAPENAGVADNSGATNVTAVTAVPEGHGVAPVPADASVTGDGAGPMDGLVPLDSAVPVDGSGPINDPVPVAGSAPSDGTVPPDGVAQPGGSGAVDNPVPGDGSAPADGSGPADVSAAADGSAAPVGPEATADPMASADPATADVPVQPGGPADAAGPTDPTDTSNPTPAPHAPGVMEAPGALDAGGAPHATPEAQTAAEAHAAQSAHAPGATPTPVPGTPAAAEAVAAEAPAVAPADPAVPASAPVTTEDTDGTADAQATQATPAEPIPSTEPTPLAVPPAEPQTGADASGIGGAAQDAVATPSAPESPTAAEGSELLTAPASAATPLPQAAPAGEAAAPGAHPGAPAPVGTLGSPAQDQLVAAPHAMAAHAAVAPQAPDAAQPWPDAHSGQGPDVAGTTWMPDGDGSAQPFVEVQEAAPIGRFVPVDGQVPTTPHLAPTPPRPLSVPPEYFVPQPSDETGGHDAAEAATPGTEPEAEPAPGTPSETGQQPAATVPAPRDGARPTAEPAGTAAPAPVDAAEDGTPAPSAPETTDPDEPMHAPHPAGPTDPASPPEQPAPAVFVDADAPEDLSTPAAPADQDGAPQPLLLTEGPEGPEGTDDTDGAPDLAEAEPPAADTAVEPPAPGYADAEREAVLRVMRERRDIRNGFRGDPIPHEVLLRVLEAAHTAPSVGHSQPWDFVVIKSAETRRTMHELAQRQREAYAKSLPKGRAKQFKELKIEAILDTPVNIVVTADPTRGGRHTLGRHTQPQMAPYSSALAVENLWLAARAEGLGVGWVSFFDEREMVRALGLPEHLEVVAYLCVGYVDEFPEEPELMQAGWSKRRPLSWVVHEETYGRRALPGEDPHDLLAETVGNIRPLDAKALGEAWERQKRMTKPAGALGMLEIISAQLSGLSRMCPPPIPEPAAVAIFAGDHGVHAQGVTSWPQEVTAQMVANFLGGGAVCNAFANQVGAEVCVIDVGVAGELPATPGLLPRKIRAGTADMTTGPALTRDEVKAAVEVGIETARDLVAAGNKALLTGEMGIANTTASAALISVYTDTDPAEVTGRGTGINDEMHARKVEVVRRALDLHQPDPADPIGVLAAIGGLEHAAMVGLLLGGASLRTPVILDGVSAGAAALVARAIAPEVLAACIAGHRSAEPGHVAALNKLGLRPLVDLDLRLGEGTGALLALPVVQSAARAMHEVATFDSAGVTEK
ncbi:nicotinate-nucleotide--dimethylbenzimidazole phosphoribosyltransferase [Streptomyces flavofungini]|uniref:nicotinate-nucleotide--dimethylbenzimidazole phosphoribosyltransferase n=1 Tax=Streptomyces flavofungini TaxID=68200 RepID=UPI0025B02DCA|nr:nicotinate-nucleotide--dimethylbenzimidazole phosphoribosyltransferase [Streptomyces flavofungini]WJV49976.1 nicotinate-nucleotide--dimethylbenzimidazole phosphoribosyltransferase [Streptomyces flavofungini]